MQRTPRRKLIVSEFQNKLTLLNVAYLSMLALTFGMVVLWPLIRASRDNDASELARASAARDLMATLSVMWPGVIAMIALYATHQIVLTHRLAGPLYRMRVTMVAMASGVFPESIRLRKNDMLNEEAGVLNALLHSLREHVFTLRQQQSEMRAALNVLERQPADEPARAQLREALSELEHELLRFDLGDSGQPAAESATTSTPAAALPNRASTSAQASVPTAKSSDATK